MPAVMVNLIGRWYYSFIVAKLHYMYIIINFVLFTILYRFYIELFFFYYAFALSNFKEDFFLLKKFRKKT